MPPKLNTNPLPFQDMTPPPSAALLAGRDEDMVHIWGQKEWAPAAFYPEVNLYDRYTFVYPPQWRAYLDAKALEDPRPAPVLPKVLFTKRYFTVKKSPKGYGAFAIQDIPKGALILAEAPLMSSEYYGETLDNAFRALSDEQKAEVVSLSSWDNGGENSEIGRIFSINAFKTGDTRSIFRIASRFNHACTPRNNIKWSYNEKTGKMEFTSTRKIKSDEEITLSYGHTPFVLKLNYGFVCDCGCNLAAPKLNGDVARRLTKGSERGLRWLNDDFRDLGSW